MKKKRTIIKYKKAVRNVIKEAKSIMLLNIYNIDIYFNKEDNERGEHIAGTCSINTKYYDVDINFYPIHFDCYKENDDYQFVKTIIHEMSHIITEPLYLEACQAIAPISRDYIETIREQTTEQIANIIYNLWKNK